MFQTSTMEKYSKILAHIPHSSIQDYNHKWSGCFMMFPKVKRLTDWHTELLFGTDNPKVKPLAFKHSRFYLDVERLENDPLEQIGQGKIYTFYDGFRRNLTEDERRNLEAIYRNWKDLCDSEVVGNTLVIDCHSFPSDMSEDVDVCIGFNDDDSKPSDEVVGTIVNEFSKLGFTVGINKPYSNSVVFEKPHKSIMIELKKSIYMDEETLLLRPNISIKVRNAIQRIYEKLT